MNKRYIDLNLKMFKNKYCELLCELARDAGEVSRLNWVGE